MEKDRRRENLGSVAPPKGVLDDDHKFSDNIIHYIQALLHLEHVGSVNSFHFTILREYYSCETGQSPFSAKCKNVK